MIGHCDCSLTSLTQAIQQHQFVTCVSTGWHLRPSFKLSPQATFTARQRLLLPRPAQHAPAQRNSCRLCLRAAGAFLFNQHRGLKCAGFNMEGQRSRFTPSSGLESCAAHQLAAGERCCHGGAKQRLDPGDQCLSRGDV